MQKPAVLVSAFLAGAAGLLLELVWSRYLALVFGLSAHALATVLAAFMLGMAVGNISAEPLLRSQRFKDRPDRLLAFLLIALAAYALCSPWVYRAAQEAGVHAIRAVGDARATVTLVRAALSFAALLVPTALLGAIFPTLVAVGKQRGVGIAPIYGINMLGAVAGAVAAGFFLMPALGLSWTLALTAAVSAAAALLAYRAAPARPAPAQKPSKSKKSKPAAEKPADSLAAPAPFIGLAIATLMGLTSLAYQVLYQRVLTLFFRDTVYDLAIVLAIFLAGLGAGGLLVQPLLRTARRAALALAAVQAALALAVVISLYLLHQYPYWLFTLQTNRAVVNAYGPNYWNAAVALRVAYTALLVLAPALLQGAAFPLAARLWTANAPRSIGALTALNALGSTGGSLLAGFALIAWLGIQHAFLFLAALNALAALALLPFLQPRPRLAVVATTVFCAILAAALPTWDRFRMSAGFLSPNQSFDPFELQFYAEDAAGITAVHYIIPVNQRFLVTNRLYSQNTSDMGGTSDHRRLGMIPMLLHPNAKSVLAVGLGAGITLRGLADFQPDALDVVEISPAVVEAARYFAKENDHVLDRPFVHVFTQDARGYLASATRDYDLIVLDILHPMSAGSSTVFSKEYFQLCRDRLAPGGLICQWLPAHQLSTENLRTIAATFRSVFPHTTIWFGLLGDSTNVIGLFGSDAPLTPDLARLTMRYQSLSPELQKELAEVRLESPEQYLTNYALPEPAAQSFADHAPIETDDHPLIEYSAPRLALPPEEQGPQNIAIIRSTR